jgi:hypothetical protein
MDDLRCDAWTRRWLGVAAGGIASAILGLAVIDDVDAKKQRNKKKCKKSKKRCGKKCIPKSNCCRDADCGGGATCQDGTCLCPDGERECEGTCISDDVCCPGEACGQNCACRRTIEGTGFCIQQTLSACEQCNSSAECVGDAQCVLLDCAGSVTATCLPPCEAE